MAAAQEAEKAFFGSIHCLNCPSLAATSGLSPFPQELSATAAATAHNQNLLMRPPLSVRWEVDSDCTETPGRRRRAISPLAATRSLRAPQEQRPRRSQAVSRLAHPVLVVGVEPEQLGAGSLRLHPVVLGARAEVSLDRRQPRDGDLQHGVFRNEAIVKVRRLLDVLGAVDALYQLLDIPAVYLDRVVGRVRHRECRAGVVVAELVRARVAALVLGKQRGIDRLHEALVVGHLGLVLPLLLQLDHLLPRAGNDGLRAQRFRLAQPPDSVAPGDRVVLVPQLLELRFELREMLDHLQVLLDTLYEVRDVDYRPLGVSVRNRHGERQAGDHAGQNRFSKSHFAVSMKTGSQTSGSWLLTSRMISRIKCTLPSFPESTGRKRASSGVSSAVRTTTLSLPCLTRANRSSGSHSRTSSNSRCDRPKTLR